MSTRAQIQIEGSDCILYQHCDGYPYDRGVLYWLIPFRDHFFTICGYDPEYFTGRALMWLGAIDANPEDKFWAKRLKEDGPPVTGYGVDTVIHGDIEWFYLIREDGTIEVRRPGGASIGHANAEPDEKTIKVVGPRGQVEEWRIVSTPVETSTAAEYETFPIVKKIPFNRLRTKKWDGKYVKEVPWKSKDFRGGDSLPIVLEPRVMPRYLR